MNFILSNNLTVLHIIRVVVIPGSVRKVMSM